MILYKRFIDNSAKRLTNNCVCLCAMSIDIYMRNSYILSAIFKVFLFVFIQCLPPYTLHKIACIMHYRKVPCLVSATRVRLVNNNNLKKGENAWNHVKAWMDGIMESWNHAIMESWNHGIMQSWNHAIMHSFIHSFIHSFMISFFSYIFVHECIVGYFDDKRHGYNCMH